MKKPLRRWVVTLGLAAAGALSGLTMPSAARAQQGTQTAAAAPQEVASVEQLKGEAFKALKSGQFDRTSELLTKAATISKDPSLSQMSDWIHQFHS